MAAFLKYFLVYMYKLYPTVIYKSIYYNESHFPNSEIIKLFKKRQWKGCNSFLWIFITKRQNESRQTFRHLNKVSSRVIINYCVVSNMLFKLCVALHCNSLSFFLWHCKKFPFVHLILRYQFFKFFSEEYQPE